MSRQDSLQGTLPLMVLKLLARRGPLHGYGLTVHIESLSEEVLSVEEGSLYPALHRMEEAGSIKAGWVTTENGRRTRMYEITAAGRKELEEQEARRRSVDIAIAHVLQRA
jgi:PadR family transcriptional regulator, regulatory protein PadR